MQRVSCAHPEESIPPTIKYPFVPTQPFLVATTLCDIGVLLPERRSTLLRRGQRVVPYSAPRKICDGNMSQSDGLGQKLRSSRSEGVETGSSAYSARDATPLMVRVF